MNDKKICFITCVNDRLYEEECCRHINNLFVPSGYSVEQFSVWEAKSMTAGYNEAMRQSDAKYKVYLHQDVFILNRHFIQDMLDVFADETVGLLGMVGAPKMPPDAVMWGADRIGALYANDCGDGPSAFENAPAPYGVVEAVDGLLMATQADIAWRDDLFGGWDFYDVSQSVEFRRAGYKVAVPYMEKPWCFHDAGFMNLDKYFYWRDVFLKEYGDMLI